MIWIAYNDGYKEVNEGEYPVLMAILSRKDLTVYNDKNNLSGSIRNARAIPALKGMDQTILSELFLTNIEYHSICVELNVDKDPILLLSEVNCLVLLRRLGDMS